MLEFPKKIMLIGSRQWELGKMKQIEGIGEIRDLQGRKDQ